MFSFSLFNTILFVNTYRLYSPEASVKTCKLRILLDRDISSRMKVQFVYKLPSGQFHFWPMRKQEQGKERTCLLKSSLRIHWTGTKWEIIIIIIIKYFKQLKAEAADSPELSFLPTGESDLALGSRKRVAHKESVHWSAGSISKRHSSPIRGNFILSLAVISERNR